MPNPFSFVESVQTIVITTLNPCTTIENDASGGDEIDSEDWYGLECNGVPVWNTTPDPDRTEVTLAKYGSGTPSWTGSLENKILLALDGEAVGRCFTIIGNSGAVVYVAEDHVWNATTNPYGIKNGDHYAIVHTARSMYDYCTDNSKKCVAVAASSINWNNASPEKPKSYSSHITPRIGTGKFKQSVSLSDCNIWYSDPRFREFILSQFNELLFKWHGINANDAVYLIMTTEYYNTLSQVTYYQNRNFFKESNLDSNFVGRGYMKGFPMGSSGKTDYDSIFSIPFDEAWD